MTPLHKKILENIPRCAKYAAHPQAVWFEVHWLPIISSLLEQNERLVEALEEAAEALANHAEDIGHYFENECLPTESEAVAIGLRAKEANQALTANAKELERLASGGGES